MRGEWRERTGSNSFRSFSFFCFNHSILLLYSIYLLSPPPDTMPPYGGVVVKWWNISCFLLGLLVLPATSLNTRTKRYQFLEPNLEHSVSEIAAPVPTVNEGSAGSEKTEDKLVPAVATGATGSGTGTSNSGAVSGTGATTATTGSSSVTPLANASPSTITTTGSTEDSTNLPEAPSSVLFPPLVSKPSTSSSSSAANQVSQEKHTLSAALTNATDPLASYDKVAGGVVDSKTREWTGEVVDQAPLKELDLSPADQYPLLAEADDALASEKAEKDAAVWAGTEVESGEGR